MIIIMKPKATEEQIGALYPQVLETLTRGACEELFPRA